MGLAHILVVELTRLADRWDEGEGWGRMKGDKIMSKFVA